MSLFGKKWRRSEHAHASYPGLFFRTPGLSPYIGWEERRVQGLDYVSLGHQNFDCRSYCGLIHRMQRARAVDVVMARAKRIYILIIKVNKLFSFFSSRCFLKEIEKACTPCFYRVIQTLVKVWENSKKLWKHSPAARVPTAFLVLPKFHSCLYLTIRL